MKSPGAKIEERCEEQHAEHSCFSESTPVSSPGTHGLDIPGTEGGGPRQVGYISDTLEGPPQGNVATSQQREKT